MQKRRVHYIIIELLVITLFLTIHFWVYYNLGVSYRAELDEKIHNAVESVWDEDNPSHIIYQGEKYLWSPFDFWLSDFSGTPNDGDVFISWNGSRYFGYISGYYSYTKDSPVFIYESHLSDYDYFHEDYDYLSDTFIIEGTDVEVVFGDMFNDYSNYERRRLPNTSTYIGMYSKQYLRIKLEFEIGVVNNKWHIYNNGWLWECSDDFIELLKVNGIIQEDAANYIK